MDSVANAERRSNKQTITLKVNRTEDDYAERLVKGSSDVTEHTSKVLFKYAEAVTTALVWLKISS